MRIERLTLDRFGHFTGKTFDFGTRSDTPDRPDFHIVYGPNEAGKTTTMEAFLRLLYGFDPRDAYGFKHQRRNLSISAVLDLNGAQTPVTRLPNGLVDPSGAALPDAVLAGSLGGLTQKVYRDLLCLDDDTIERGGEEILRARGDMGRLLFSAAAGISTLTGLLDDVRTQADAVYKARASKTTLAQLRSALRDIDARIKDEDVNASAYRKLRKALRDAKAQEADLSAALSDQQDHMDALRTQRAVLPDLAELDRLDAIVTDGLGWPSETGIDPERLVTLETDLARAKADVARLTDDLAALDNALTQTPRSPNTAALHDTVTALGPSHGRVSAAALDLPKRRQALDAATADLAQAVADLGLTRTDPQSLVLSELDIQALEPLAASMTTAKADVKAAQHEAGLAKDAYQHARAALDALPAPDAAAQAIAQALRTAEIDTLAPAYAAAQTATHTAQMQVQDALDALATEAASVTDLPPCGTTPPEAAAWLDALKHAQSALTHAQNEQAALRADASALSAQLDVQTDPTDAAAGVSPDAAKATRDTLWAQHRTTLDATTAQAFEQAMHQTDTAMAAQLALSGVQSDRRAKRQTLAELKARIEAGETHLTTLTKAQSDLEARFAQAARAAGLPQTWPPAALCDWFTNHAAAAKAVRLLHRTREAHAQTLTAAKDLAKALADLGLSPGLSFDAQIAEARRIAAQDHSTRDRHSRAQADADLAKTALSARQAALEHAEQTLAQARQAWDAALARSADAALSALPPDQTLRAFLRLREIDGRRAENLRRTQTIDADQAEFDRQITNAAARFGLAAKGDASATFDVLRQMAAQAQKDDETHAALTEKRATQDGQRQKAVARVADINTEIETLAQVLDGVAQVSTLPELRAAVAQASTYGAARQDHAKRLARVLRDMRAADLESVRAQMDALSETALDARLAEQEDHRVDLRTRLDAASETRINAGRDLAAVGADAGIAALTEQRAVLVLEIEAASRRYLELELGHRLATEAIRRYRDTHRSGMLTASERLFSDLTDGAYPRLDTHRDGGDERLLAVDAQGIAKRAEDMSKGTRFQLFLALRAAAYEQLVAQGTRLPFFCDDVFETFDETRTRAAARVMEQIGRSGQAIYLTHHRHVVEIAQAVCDTPPIIHEITYLDGRG